MKSWKKNIKTKNIVVYESTILTKNKCNSSVIMYTITESFVSENLRCQFYSIIK